MKQSTIQKIVAYAVAGFCILALILFIVMLYKSDLMTYDQPAPFGTDTQPAPQPALEEPDTTESPQHKDD